MKNYKQINIKMSTVDVLDEIREQLPKRGTLKASYGDAIVYMDDMRCLTEQYRIQNERLLHENIGLKKKVRK